MGNIGEGKGDEKAEYFPIIWGSLQAANGVVVSENQAQLVCNIWREDVYFGEEESIEATTAKAIGYVQDLVQQFGEEYVKANGHDRRPHFYLVANE